MRIKIAAVFAIVSLMSLAAAPLWAHHAFASEFDAAKPLTLKGTIKKVELINPHSWFHVDVKDETGKVVTWMVEGGSPNALIRLGITQASLPIGTEIVVEAFQAKDGTNKACGVDLTYADSGKRVFMGGSAGGGEGR